MTVLLKLDRTLAVMLLLGAAGHTAGACRAYADQPMMLLWALCATLAVVLIAALNLLRAARPGDRLLAWVAAAGTASWLPVTLAFGTLIGNVLDPRVIVFEALSLALTGLSVRDALRRKGRPAAQVAPA
jgi:hypothetical protein